MTATIEDRMYNRQQVIELISQNESAAARKNQEIYCKLEKFSSKKWEMKLCGAVALTILTVSLVALSILFPPILPLSAPSSGVLLGFFQAFTLFLILDVVIEKIWVCRSRVFG